MKDTLMKNLEKRPLSLNDEDTEPSTEKLRYSPEDPAIRESLKLCAVEFDFNPA